MTTCSKCGASNVAKAATCWSCGASIAKVPHVPKSQPPPGPPQRHVYDNTSTPLIVAAWVIVGLLFAILGMQWMIYERMGQMRLY